MTIDRLLDSILGKSYLAPQEFIKRAKAFGCDRAIEGVDTDNILAMLSSASRAVDVYCAREPGSFSGDILTENHTWNPDTRRIIINQPPVSELVSVAVRTSPGSIANFPVTPVLSDGENNVAFGPFYYNVNENYLELNSLALAGSMTSVLVSLGMMESIVEVRYRSYSSVPAMVAAATGFTAAHIANEYFSSSMAPGMKRVKTDSEEFIKEDLFSQDARFIVPPSAARFLYSLSRISIG